MRAVDEFVIFGGPQADAVATNARVRLGHVCKGLEEVLAVYLGRARVDGLVIGGALLMIQSCLWWLDTIPVKPESVVRIGVGHLVEAIVSPELSSLPCIFHRDTAARLQCIGNVLDILPHP